MGNAIHTPCFGGHNHSAVKVISYGGGPSRILTGKHLAGEIMFEFPDRMLCHADSFFIGKPIPSLAISDKLINGQTYFLLPLDSFANKVLNPSSLTGLGSRPGSKGNLFRECPFEYMRGSDGRALIKVRPEFIAMLIGDGDQELGDTVDGSPSSGFLCSTPELQKHYSQLVGSKDQIWSPKLKTISEYKIRFSPCRFVGLEWREKEGVKGS